jgi:hypothetical protein
LHPPYLPFGKAQHKEIAMTQNTQTQITWSQIVKTIAAKTKDDYTSQVKPAVNTGRIKLGSLIEALGRKIQK